MMMRTTNIMLIVRIAYPYTMNCFVVWKKQEEKNIISVWNYVTGEMHTITETMPLETFAFRIKPSGNIAFMGHIATTASFWVYDGDSNFGDKFNSSEFKTTKPFYICIGKDSILAENTDVYGGYNWHFSHVDYMEEEK